MIVKDSPERIPVDMNITDDRIIIKQGTAEVSLTGDELDAVIDALDNRPRFGKLWSNRG